MIFQFYISFAFLLTSSAFNGYNLKAIRVPHLLLHEQRDDVIVHDKTRRRLFNASVLFISSFIAQTNPVNAGTFTPGGTLVDREVGARVGNVEASKSRNLDNGNVLFKEDHYFKFGTAAPWIEPDSTAFPKTIPFVLSQQRYDALKKYKTRVEAGIDKILALEERIKDGDYKNISDGDDPAYGLRPLGLLANSFLASENTGTTNELLLTRWYINEIFLRIGELRSISDIDQGILVVGVIKKAINSYLTVINRAITSKVGDKFKYV
jgi:hypothetical protein